MKRGKLNGLDLFSGIGGIAEALSPWVETVAYCENERYAQAVLLSRMSRGEIHTAPIWDDVTTLKGSDLPEIDIISGGFPCQDISVAGRGAGLEGKRSSLFGEIIRLSSELRPQFIFLENVPAITFRGLSAVTGALAELRYDCRWGLLSAYDMGAPHKRERWWLLTSNTSGVGNGREEKRGIRPPGSQSKRRVVSDLGEKRPEGEDVADTDKERLEGRECGGLQERAGQRTIGESGSQERGRETISEQPTNFGATPGGAPGPRYHWSTEPNVGRVVNGLPLRSNRLMCLGNSVVPQCAREAFKRLMGL